MLASRARQVRRERAQRLASGEQQLRCLAIEQAASLAAFAGLAGIGTAGQVRQPS
jgi:hypothetical protein